MNKIIIFLLATALLFSGCAQQNTNSTAPIGFVPLEGADSGLVAHYKFDEGTGTVAQDSSTNANTATLTNGAAWGTGKIGVGAISFDGNQSYADTNITSAIDSSGFTISAWIMPQGGTNIVTKGTSGNAGFWRFLIGGTRLQFEKDGSSDLVARSLAAITTGSWQHVAVTWTGDENPQNVHFYVNGNEVVKDMLVSPVAMSPDPGITDIIIGARRESAKVVGGFKGEVDELRIYSRPLSEDEIFQIYFIDSGNAQPDSQPPTVPIALATVGVASTRATITWQSSTDDNAVAGYNIFRNGNKISQTTTNSYTDTALSPSTQYTYSVSAYDAARNVSAQSESITLTTIAQTNGTTPGNNITEPGEACDGTDLDGYTCATLAAGFKSGNLRCKSDTSGFDASQCVKGNTVSAASCSSADVQNAINAALDGDTVLVPQGTCTWTTPVNIGTYSAPTRKNIGKSIILQGAGIDKTTIIGNTGSTWNLSILLQQGKPVRITGFTFDGSNSGDNYGIVHASGEGGSKTLFRVDHSKFVNIIERGVSVNAAYGLIDHDTFIRISSGPYSATLISLDGDIYNSGSIGSWGRPQDLGTINDVYIEDNTFIHSIQANGPYDAYQGARYVFRYNDVFGNGLGHHGFDSGIRGQPNFEIYENTFINASPTGELFVHGIVFEFRSGTGVIFNNTVNRAPNATGHLGKYDYFGILKNYRSGDGFITNYGYPFPWDGIRPGNGVCDGTNSFDGNEKDFDTDGDGVFDKSSGYPCRDQIGRTSFQELSPLYAWNNNFQGNIGGNLLVSGYATFQCQKTGGSTLVSKIANPAPGNPISWICTDADGGANETMYERINLHVIEGRDYFNGVPKPGYVPYVYPHPLAQLDSTSPPVTAQAQCAVAQNTCAKGTPNDIADSNTHYLWNCTNGSSTALCSLAKTNTPVNGVCSAQTNTCTTGTFTDTNDSQTHNLWNCNGTSGGINATCSSPKQITGLDSDGDGVDNAIDRCPKTKIAARPFVNQFGCAQPIATRFDIKPDFNSIDINGMQSFELGISTIGKITFTNQNIMLVKTSSGEDDRLNLDGDINITTGKITLNQNNLPQLNKPATVTLYGINTQNPIIKKDESICTQCSIISYDKTNGTLIFTVPGF